jgi:hypothetical protein
MPRKGAPSSRNVAPLHGHPARYGAIPNAFTDFAPVHGWSVVM